MAARRTALQVRSAAAAMASSITESSAPWRTLPVTRLRRNSCSASVRRPNSVVTASRRAPVEPGPGQRADLLQRRVDLDQRHGRLGRPARGSSASAAPAQAGAALAQRAGEVRRCDVDLLAAGARPPRAAGRRSARAWPAANGWRRPGRRRRRGGPAAWGTLCPPATDIDGRWRAILCGDARRCSTARPGLAAGLAVPGRRGPVHASPRSRRPDLPAYAPTARSGGASAPRRAPRPCGSCPTRRPGRSPATAWGSGAEWVLGQLPRMLGADDDPSGFVPLHEPIATPGGATPTGGSGPPTS